jgi:hypothetical protein
MKLTLTKQQAESLGSLVAFADKGRDANRVLTEIKVTVKDGQLTAVATDRYTVARFIDEVVAPDMEFRITSLMAKWITDNLKVKGYSPELTLEPGEIGSVTASLEDGARNFTDSVSNWKFPEVEKLFTEWEAAATIPALSLRAEFLGKLEKLKANGQKAEVWRFEPGANKFNGNKPGPVKATALKVDSKLTALIQPNLLVD